jgi:membrane protein
VLLWLYVLSIAVLIGAAINAAVEQGLEDMGWLGHRDARLPPEPA